MSEDTSERRRILDPAVADILDGMQRKQEERKLPTAERKRKASERMRAKERLSGRVNYDLPEGIKQRLRELARHERVPESQLAALALARFLADVAAGRVRLSDYRKPSRSPKFDWTLDLSSFEG